MFPKDCFCVLAFYSFILLFVLPPFLWPRPDFPVAKLLIINVRPGFGVYCSPGLVGILN